MTPCCGKKRTVAAVGPQNANNPSGGVAMPTLVFPPKSIHFRYEGTTAMTVVGPISQIRYRFGFPGAVVEIDGRDGAALSAVPHVRRI